MSTRPPLSWPRRAGPARSRTGSSPARPPSPPWRAVARGSSAALVPPRARSSTARQPRPCRRTAGWSILAPGRWRWIRLLDTHNTHPRARAQRDSRLKEGSREPSRHMPRARVHRPSIHRLRLRAGLPPRVRRVGVGTSTPPHRATRRAACASAQRSAQRESVRNIRKVSDAFPALPPVRVLSPWPLSLVRGVADAGVAAPLLGHA